LQNEKEKILVISPLNAIHYSQKDNHTAISMVFIVAESRRNALF